MIEVENLTKRYGDKVAVDGLSFTVQPGIVTGFLGPNGAGKSTTMRMIAGLDRPTAGPGPGQRPRATATAAAPMAELGILLEARAVHTGRSARNHLLALAPDQRHRRAPGRRGHRPGRPDRASPASASAASRSAWASGWASPRRCSATRASSSSTSRSTGSTPRACCGSATCSSALAAEGRTVFVSSHLMSEMALTADHLVVIGRGRLIADTTVDEFVAARRRRSASLVRTPDARPSCATAAGRRASRCPARRPTCCRCHGLSDRADRHDRLAGAACPCSS